MELVPENHLLQLSSNVIHEIRKIHNLHKPGRIEEAIDILEQWLQKQNHFLKKDFGRNYLERSLISCKGSVEKAKKQIDRLCTMKTLMPHFFTATSVSLELREMLGMAWLVPLPKITNDFYRVVIIKVCAKQLTKQNFVDFFRYNMLLCEYLKAHDYVNGFMIIEDFRETELLEIITKMSTVDFQHWMAILVEGYGTRLKGIHIISQSKVVDVLVKLAKSLLSEKIGKRFHVHNDIEELYDVIPRDILPVEYGGKERSITELQEDWINVFNSDEHVEYMKIMNKACTDESLRSTDKFNQEYMGMAGSFRNLSVD